MNILVAKKSIDYELIDSGAGEKLERFGQIVLRRPDPQALWQPRFDSKTWNSAEGYFTRSAESGRWSLDEKIPKKWLINFAELKLWIKPTAFKHTGLFPEQISNWQWLSEVVSPGDEVLNLFGYTGGATLASARSGAKVVHVDSSKSAVTWARENAESSGLADKPIRWIIDDAMDFVKKELKRGHKYSGIIMDPPAFGHGPNGEIWKIEDSFTELLDICLQLLTDSPKFFLVNGYSAGYSAIAYENNLKILVQKYGGAIESGELVIEESGDGARLLPCGIYARWSRG